MKNFLYITTTMLSLLIVTFSFSQTKQAEKPVKAKETNKKMSSSLPEGFENAKWGGSFKDVKNIVRGKLVYADENKTIISRDEEITFKYGFFFQDPKMLARKNAPTAESETTENAPANATEARLFYVAVEFPYLALKSVKEQTEKKFGNPTIESVTKNKGVLVWESDKTIIILWVDSYEKKSFCRKINYISKEISKELADYHYKIFNKVEISVLNDLYK